MVLFRHVAYCLASSVHDDVSVRLFDAQEDVHHLYLPLNDQRTIVQESHGWMGLVEDTIGIIRYIDRRKQIGRLILGKGGRD